MADIILPGGRFRTQPQNISPVDLQGLGKGLQILFNPAIGPLDLVTGRMWTPNGNTNITTGTFGRAFSFDGVDDDYEYTGYPEIVGAVGTFFVWCPVVGVADSFGHILFADSIGSSYYQIDTFGVVYAAGSASTGSLSSWFSTNNRSLVVSIPATGAIKVYLDGADSGITFSGSPSGFPAGSKTLGLGKYAGGSSWDFSGTMLSAGYSSRAWGEAEAKAFHDSKGNALYKTPVSRIWISAAAGGTVALTGQSAASAQGSLAPATNKALSGQSVTSSQGTLSAASAVTLSGQLLTPAQGSLSPALSKALSGQALASTQGSLSSASSITISGQALTSAGGTLAPATAIQLSGQSLTYSQGTLGVSGSGSVALTGQILASTQGSISPATSAALLGQGLSSSAGNLSPATGKALTGSGLASAQGSVAPSLAVALVGQLLSSATGTLSVAGAGAVALSGQGATISQGALAPAVSVALSGLSVALAQGLLSSEIGLSLSGQSILSLAGLLASSRTKAIAGQQTTFSQGLMSVSGGAGEISSTVERTTAFHASVSRGAVFQRSKSVTVKFN